MNFRDGAVALAIAWVALHVVPPVAAQGTAGGFAIPPCAGEPSPPYPALGPFPEVKVWRDAELSELQLPACAGFGTLAPNTLVATVGRFEDEGGIEAIAGRVARISALTNIRYYSVKDSAWKQLFLKAYALGDMPPPRGAEARRDDFTAADIVTGRTLRYWLEENSLLSAVVYRLSVIERTPDKLVYTIVNETAAKALLLRAGEPGDFRQFFVLERETGTQWRYYSLAAARIRMGPFSLSSQSFMNRAIAYYRHLAGFPTELSLRQGP